MRTLDWFDARGNFVEAHDPYRDDDTEFYRTFFDNHGNLRPEVRTELEQYLTQYPRGADALSDIVGLVIADRFAANTKNNYSTIYLWR